MPSWPTPPAQPEQPLTAEVIELEYAGPRRGQLIGRDARGGVVVPLRVELPRRCYKSGMTEAEAQSAGQTLMEYDKRMSWAPKWVTLLVVLGLLLFLPMMLVGVVLYFVMRQTVQVRLSIRRDIWWKRSLANWICAILALVSIAAGFIAAVQTQVWWILLPAFVLAIALAVVATTYGRIIGVRKVVNNQWAHLAGAGQQFLEREQFDFAVT